jgi:hypothetical protein
VAAVAGALSQAKHRLWSAAGLVVAAARKEGSGDGSAPRGPEIEPAGGEPSGTTASPLGRGSGGAGEGAQQASGCGGKDKKRSALRRGLHRCAKRGREARAALVRGVTGCFGL